MKQYDTRDEQEHQDVRSILAALPEDHPARVAYSGGADTIRLSHLVADRPELVEGLKAAYLAGYSRLRRSVGHFRP